MARHTKSGLDYFALDTDFFDDERLYALEDEFGPQGQIVAIRLLCMIYHKGYFLEWTRLTAAKMLRQMASLTPETLETIVGRLTEWGFFDRGLFEAHSVLTSELIQARYFEAARKRKQPQQTPPYLLIGPPPAAATTEASAPKTPAAGKDFDALLTEATAQPDWVGAIARNLKLSRQDVTHRLVTDFRQHCLREGKTHRDLSDFKSHFNRWSAQQLKPTNATAKNDKRQPDNQFRPSGNLTSRLPVEPSCGLKRRPDSQG
ncbi:MAG: DUF4373 domain-containing protein [Muribaculaceae bacterium]|nr:DUF4373 domain-containing protein [Muribaculaceae bacterium]